MRLLRYGGVHRFHLTSISDSETPKYAILSHTWEEDNEKEVTFSDIEKDDPWWKPGFRKLDFLAEQATRDGLEHFWADTCCINKADFHEFTTAITSMFQWYGRAEKCYVYLSDVSTRTSRNQSREEHEWMSDFRKSRWFTRGWTLQELLAPKIVEFFSQDQEFLGTKVTLATQIHEITTIPLTALEGKPLWQFSDTEKMRWTENRRTKKVEDIAYSLLGIFGVYMPLMYGEGENALRRLREEIEKKRIRESGDARRSMRNDVLGYEVSDQHDQPYLINNSQHNVNRGRGPVNNIASISGSTVFNQVHLSIGRSSKGPESPQSLTLSEKEFLHSFGPQIFRPIDGDRVPGTCTWTTKSVQYNSWLSTTNPSILWITGAAGTGKTTLTTFLVEQLEQLYSTQNPNVTGDAVCSFFCSKEIEGRHDVLSLVQDLTLQLVRPRKKILRLVKSAYGSAKQESSLSLEKFWRMFRTVVDTLTCRCVFITIDALDECDTASRTQVLRRLAHIISAVTNSPPNTRKVVKVNISGQSQIRTSWHKTAELVEHHEIDIEDRSTGITGDLELFVEIRVDELASENSFSAEVAQFLKRTLKSMAESSFLWLNIILKHIQQSLAYRLEDVKQLLTNSPADLHQAYARYLPVAPPDDRRILQRYLNLLVACSRPLLLAEIDVLMVSDHEQVHRMLTAGSANMSNVRASLQRGLGPLVRFPQNTAQFCHSTARDFFMTVSLEAHHPLHQSHGVDLNGAHLLYARLCLSYLLHPHIPEDIFKVGTTLSTPVDAMSPTSDHNQQEDHDLLMNLFDVEDIDFLKDPDLVESETCDAINQQYEGFDYAATNWTYHLRKVGNMADKHLTTMALFLMTGQRGRPSDWYRYLKHRSGLHMPGLDSINAVSLAATFDLDHLLKTVLEDSSFEKDETLLSEALFWASSRGCEGAVKTLLTFGTSTKASRIHQAPLVAAAQAGHKVICDLLLESHSIDPNQSNSQGKQALVVAAEANHTDIVRSMLRHKDIHAGAHDGDGRTALTAACRSGSLESFRVLCQDKRIDVNAADSNGQTALHHASRSGHYVVVRELLRVSGLDQAIVDITGRNATSLASQHGHLKVVRLLMQHGVDPSAQDQHGRNSISWAANSVDAVIAADGRESVLQYLVRKAPQAADVQDRDGWTPLAWALDPPGYVKAVEVLASLSAVDINRRDDGGRCPIAWAAASGMEEIVSCLLRMPAVDVNATSDDGTTPLMLAAANGGKAVVEVLMQCAQVDVGQKDSRGRTAFDLAVRNSHVDIAELLERHGKL